MPRNVERAIAIGRRRGGHPNAVFSVHGTEPQGAALCATYAVPRAGNRHEGQVWQGAVATPVFGRLRPPNPSCTPIVASRVVTARLPLEV